VWNDKLYQVYVNGRFAGTTLDCEQRQIVVSGVSSFETAVRIEVFAVEPEEAYIDFGDLPGLPYPQSGRVRVKLLRSQALPMGGSFDVYFDNGTGQIDYEQLITERPVRIWGCGQDKGGWGQSSFGESDFGRDWSAGIGFGRGVFGQGEFGAGAEAIEWISGVLEAGVYRFGVKIRDVAGNESSGVETGEVTVIPAARLAEQVSIDSFDEQAGQVVLAVS